MQSDLKHLKTLASKILGADEDEQAKYQDALQKGILAASEAKKLLENLKAGNEDKVYEQISEYEDVQKTWEAIGKIEHAIDDAENAIQLKDVLDYAETAIKIGVTVATII